MLAYSDASTSVLFQMMPHLNASWTGLRQPEIGGLGFVVAPAPSEPEEYLTQHPSIH